MADVLTFEASHLIDLSVFGSFSVAVQDAISDLRRQADHVPVLINEIQSLHESLDNMRQTSVATAVIHHRVERLAVGRKNAAHWILRHQVLDPLRRWHFRAWERWARRRRGRAHVWFLQRSAACKAVRPFYDKLNLFRAKSRAKSRNMRALMLRTMRGTLQTCFSKLRAFASRRREWKESRRLHYPASTAQLLQGSRRRVLAKYYTKLALYERAARKGRHRHTISHALLVQNGKVLCQRYFEKWIRWSRLINAWKAKRRMRGERLRQLMLKTQCTVLGRYFRKLMRYAEIRTREREKEDIIARLAELTLRSDANATESLLEMKMDTDTRVGELLAKCDLIGSQVDISLTSLSNTNNVLNKMVDRLLSVDEHLDILHKEKVSRVELEVLHLPPPARHESVRLSPRRRHGSPPPQEVAPPQPQSQSRQVSPVRQRAESEGLSKQRTTFAGFGGVINATASVAAASAAAAAPGTTATKELDSILRRLEQRQKSLGLSPGGQALAGGHPQDAAHHAQKELDALRVRDLESKLGLPQQQGFPYSVHGMG